jgi:hypothetical protein
MKRLCITLFLGMALQLAKAQVELNLSGKIESPRTLPGSELPAEASGKNTGQKPKPTGD